MHRAIGAALAAFLIALVCGAALLPLLRKLKFGQPIYELGPKSHYSKQGTPTMGGLVFALSAVLVTILLHRGTWHPATDITLAVILLCLGNMLIGGADDFLKIHFKNSKGLSPKQKLIPQTLLALAFSIYCYWHPSIGSTIAIPFLGREWSMGWLYIPFATLVVVSTANSANLLDGLDGLLGTVATLDMLTFGVVVLATMLAGTDAANNMAGFSFAVAGALLGFLFYNVHPARMFMGDTGSMFIGGAVAAMGLTTRNPLLIVIVCVCMWVSSVSVLIQRFYYRRTGGKRIFLSSPLHHHFELKGMAETTIVSMYGLATLALCLLGLFSL